MNNDALVGVFQKLAIGVVGFLRSGAKGGVLRGGDGDV
jgi:hypothetical protein